MSPVFSLPVKLKIQASKDSTGQLVLPKKLVVPMPKKKPNEPEKEESELEGQRRSWQGIQQMENHDGYRREERLQWCLQHPDPTPEQRLPCLNPYCDRPENILNYDRENKATGYHNFKDMCCHRCLVHYQSIVLPFQVLTAVQKDIQHGFKCSCKTTNESVSKRQKKSLEGQGYQMTDIPVCA